MKKTPTPKPRAGRPTAKQAAQRHIELLKGSLQLFLEKGLDGTTLDEIAAALHMTKRTIYGYYDNKEALFKAALQGALKDNTLKLEALEELDDGDLESTLAAVARQRVKRYLSPESLALQGLLNAESHRFPELLGMFYQENTGSTVAFIKQVLCAHAQKGTITLERPEATAALFLSMAVGAPARGMLTGVKVEGVLNLEDHIQFCVQLFVYGLKGKTPNT